MPRTPNAAFDLNGFLPYQLDAISSRVSEALFGFYGERHDLRVPDWRVLVWLDHEPELAAKDIAVHARMDKATVSRALSRLESRDLVARSVSADDQRSQSLKLTRKGKALLGRLLPQVQKWEASLLASFSATEQRQFREFLGRLEAQLDAPPAPTSRRSRSAGREPGKTQAKTAKKAARASGRSAPKTAEKAAGKRGSPAAKEVKKAGKPQRPTRAPASVSKASRSAKGKAPATERTAFSARAR